MMMSKMISLLLTAVLGTALVAGGVGQKMERQEVDVILFAGQSNISGLGDASKAPEVLEGVGYNLKIIRDILLGGAQMEKLAMIGGGAKGRTWLQILSDIWQQELTLPRYREEATSMGAAVCLGVGLGLYEDFTAAERLNPDEDCVRPDAQNAAVYARGFARFDEAYTALRPLFAHVAQDRAESL